MAAAAASNKLIQAAGGGNVAVVQELLAAGAGTEACEAPGWGALHHAAGGGHVACVEALLAAGASIDALCADGTTALAMAVINGRTACVKALLAAGAGPETAGPNASTAMVHATVNGRVDFLTMMFAAGANPSASDPKKGISILHYAVANNDCAVVQCLVAAGADLAAQDFHGRTPRQLAEERGKLGTSLARLLRQLERAARARKGESKGSSCAFTPATCKAWLRLQHHLFASVLHQLPPRLPVLTTAGTVRQAQKSASSEAACVSVEAAAAADAAMAQLLQEEEGAESQKQVKAGAKAARKQRQSERQRLQQCLRHSLNNLFQRIEFQSGDLDAIANQLAPGRPPIWHPHRCGWPGAGARLLAGGGRVGLVLAFHFALCIKQGMPCGNHPCLRLQDPATRQLRRQRARGGPAPPRQGGCPLLRPRPAAATTAAA